MTRQCLTDLHPDDAALWLNVEKAVWRLCLAANLKRLPRCIVPTPKRSLDSRAGQVSWGRCGAEVEISLRYFFDAGKWSARYPLHYMLDTIAHEVAHVAVGFNDDHGPKFFQEFSRLLVIQEQLGLRHDLSANGVTLAP